MAESGCFSWNQQDSTRVLEQSDMRVLLLSPLLKFSGNLATVVRIKNELEKHGIQCFLKCPLEIADRIGLESILKALEVDVVIAVHVYKSGKLLAGVAKPYILIVGGTDVNECSLEEDKMVVMTEAVQTSRHTVAFSESLAAKFKTCWPKYDQLNVSIIPQGVEVCPSDFSIKAYLQSHVSASSEADVKGNRQEDFVYGCKLDTLLSQLETTEAKLFTSVGGIRPVKNPLFLMKTFSDWRNIKDRLNCWLLFIGANQNDDFFERFKDEIKRCPGVVYIPGLSTEDTHSVIRDSFALVNSSDSEGMALAILEAMALKTPVIARNIPGNTAIIDDSQTGFIYDTPERFIEKAQCLLGDPHFVDTVSRSAFTYICEHHSVEYEEKSYVNLVKRLCL